MQWHGRASMRWTSRVLYAVLVCGAAAVAGAASPPSPAARASSPAARLPDWSGTWEAVSYKRHMLGHGRAPYRDLDPPFNAKVAAQFRDYKAIAYQGGTFPSRADRCVSFGAPGDMDHPATFLQFLFTAGQVTLLAPTFWRVIHTDGRAHDEQFVTFQGDSIGHWEADGTLVVETTSLDPGNEFILGIAQGRNSRLTERFRRLDARTLVDDVLLEAPEVLDKPYQYRIEYQRVDQPLVEIDCAQDNRDVDAAGKQIFNLAPPGG